MKHPKSRPDKLSAEGNRRFRKLVKSFRVLNLNRFVITIQTVEIVIITIKKIDFCREKYSIKGQNKLNKVVIILYASHKSFIDYKELCYD
jgi:hypothetical protein